MLSAYNYEICYKTGADHANADGLSQLPVARAASTIPIPGGVLCYFVHFRVLQSNSSVNRHRPYIV